ncbi:baculoviral IAP repeat-containing protein 7-A-like [Gigantopelta aegis]|uniref:baculoviral IAP repeat-containing protein 7-A-like n=1 Tax=Gigantopelta aegis TaxID=1735272 RepID=UPI001B88B50E|nr:baculoviral IAP repeat-containing protein 7-A-like [Gigantopelta aegis]
MQVVNNEKGKLAIGSHSTFYCGNKLCYDSNITSYHRQSASFLCNLDRSTSKDAIAGVFNPNNWLYEAGTQKRRTTKLFQIQSDAIGSCNGPTQSNAKHSEFSDYTKRLDSFRHWTAVFPHQSPQHMAKEGFFFLGTLDRVRCFYCGITLRDWDEEDDPYEAHLEWSEDCNFIKQRRQEKIVERRQVARFEGVHGNRPVATMTSQEMAQGSAATTSYPSDPEYGVTRSVAFAYESTASAVSASSSTGMSSATSTGHGATSATMACETTASTATSSSQEAGVCAALTNQEPQSQLHSTQIEAVIEMGYSLEVIERAITARHQAGLGEFADARELFEAVLELEK